MSLLRTFERASSRICTHEIAHGSLFAFLCPALYDTVPHVPPRKRRRRVEAREAKIAEAAEERGSSKSVENGFISADDDAGSSRGRPYSGMPLLSRHLKSRLRMQEHGCQRRGIHTKPTRPAQKPVAANHVTKDELHDLVDIYETRDRDKDKAEWAISDQDIDLDSHPDLHGGLEDGTDKPLWDDSYFTQNSEFADDTPVWTSAGRTISQMQSLLEDPDAPHEDLYTLYKSLPGNRVTFIPPETLRKLLTHLSHIPRSRFQKSYADDFLSVLYDMRAEKLDVNIALWTTAIRYIGLGEGVKQAVRLWREMEEHYAPLKANHVTFSVLFDLAVKSQHFALAEMIEKESRERHIPLDRISRMARIFYHGILGDGAGVRRAYAQFVEAGEIVDTAVLTNVITALIDAGEFPAAEETFSRMKSLHASRQGATSPPHHWRQRRELKSLLTEAAHRYREPSRAEDRRRFQDAAPVGPDWRTYRAFISYHARETGSWSAIESLLLQMKQSSIPLNREIYATLFRGFAKHGGIQLAAWNKRNLELVWREFERASRARPGEFGFDPGLCVAVVKAFAYCVDKRRAREVWEVMLERWGGSGGVESQVERILRATWQQGAVVPPRRRD